MESQDRNTIDSVSATAQGEAYEPLTGRWSRLIAPKFLAWLGVRSRGSWLDIGCGTGALIQATLDTARPAEVVGVDPSSAYIAYARREIDDSRVRFEVGKAANLPFASNQFDGVVSGLVLNVLSPWEQREGVQEMARTARQGGRVGSYGWDYAEGMQPRSLFWRVSAELDAGASEFDERNRYPICTPEALSRLFERAGLNAVQSTSIDVEARFEDFSDFWEPHLAGYGMPGRYVATLTDGQRESLKSALEDTLPIDEDGSITLSVRALAVKGVK